MFTGSVEWSVYSHVNDPWRMGLSWALSAHMCQVLGRSITIIYIWLQIDQYDRICTAISNLDCTSCDAIGLLWPALPTSENVRGLSLCTDQIRCHLAGDIFYKHLHLQTTNCRVGNRLQDFQKPEETVGRCWKKGADQMIDLWEVTKRWTSFVQLSETKSNVEDRHGSERAYEPIWVGSQP